MTFFLTVILSQVICGLTIGVAPEKLDIRTSLRQSLSYEQQRTEVVMKRCTKCNHSKPFDCFHKDSAKKDGLASSCRECHSKQKASYYNSLTPDMLEKRRVRSQSFRESNPNASRKASKKWRSKNPEAVKRRNDEFLQQNPNYAKNRRKRYPRKYAEWSRSWISRNPHAPRTYTAAYRTRKKKAIGIFTQEDVDMIMRRQKGECVVCKINIKKNYHCDHIIALSNGGSNDKNNIQLLCPSCNQSKGAKDPIEFMQSRGYLL